MISLLFLRRLEMICQPRFHVNAKVIVPEQRWKQPTAQKNLEVGQADPSLCLQA